MAETWVAECGVRGSFAVTGVVLLLVAIAFMVVGVLTEFYAKGYVVGKRKAKLSNIGHRSKSIRGGIKGGDNGTTPLHRGPEDMTLGTGTWMAGNGKLQYGATASGIGYSGGKSGIGNGEADVNSNVTIKSHRRRFVVH